MGGRCEGAVGRKTGKEAGGRLSTHILNVRETHHCRARLGVGGRHRRRVEARTPSPPFGGCCAGAGAGAGGLLPAAAPAAEEEAGPTARRCGPIVRRCGCIGGAGGGDGSCILLLASCLYRFRLDCGGSISWPRARVYMYVSVWRGLDRSKRMQAAASQRVGECAPKRPATTPPQPSSAQMGRPTIVGTGWRAFSFLHPHEA